MKGFITRFMSIACVIAALGSLPLFANGEGEAENIDELTMYLIGEPHRDTDAVIEELNTMMAEDIGATLKVNYLPWGDWRTKYPLLFASGEKFDLIYTSDWAFYFREARNGAFLDITDLAKEVTPELYGSLPADAWNQTLIDGRSYMIPSNSPEYDGYGFLYRKDLAQKYGLKSDITSLADLERYLEAVKSNEPSMIPYNAGTWDLRLIELMFSGLKSEVYLPVINEDWNIFVDMANLDGPLTIDEYDPEFKAFASTMRQWQQKGFWSKNVMSNQIGSRDAFENGTSAIALCNSVNFNNLYQNTSERHPDWEFGYFDFYQDKPVRLIFPYISNGMGINRNASHPEKALKLLEKLHMDDRYYNLTQYGQEGVHYVVEDGKMAFPEGFDSADGWSFTAWGWNEVSKLLPSKNDWEHWLELQEAYGHKKAVNPIGDFSFDETPIESEIAAVSNVMAQYKTPLYWGLVEPEAGLAALHEQLELAGYSKIIEEAERQYRAYRSGK
ncbi:MAG: ABC transporter substrate-binding protein [Spirochaetales bacterium]|nr:ABC transporter substrate-binding protein [Spirochaetales bacterium]